MCLIWLEIRHHPITTHTQIHAWNTAKASIIIRHIRKKCGVMKPSIWMINHKSNSQLPILVATTYGDNMTAWHILHRPEKQYRKHIDICCVNGEYGRWGEIMVFPYCISQHLGKVQDARITASLLPQPTLLDEANITCKLAIPLLNAGCRRSVSIQIFAQAEPLLLGDT